MSTHARQCQSQMARFHPKLLHGQELDAVAQKPQGIPLIACHEKQVLRCSTFGLTMHHMTTSKPRITVNLEPVTALQLKRISELTGNSQSSMISEVLEQASPVFERLIVVLEAAETAKARVREQSIERLSDAQARIEAQLGLVLDDFDRTTAPLLEQVEKVPRRRRASGAREGHAGATAPLPTPISNRGVRSTQKATKVIAKNDGSEKVLLRKVRAKTVGGRNGQI